MPVRYTGSTKREGRTVNVYRITVSAPVKDPAVLEPLPPALPRKLVAGLLPGLDTTTRARFTPAALSALPDPVPLAYQGRSTLVAYVDRQTGVAIDQSVTRSVVATAAVGGEPATLLPVSAFTFRITPASAKDLGDTAASAGLMLTLLKDVAPLALLGLAVVLLLIAVLRRNRRPGTSAPSAPASPVTPPEPQEAPAE
ncbi:porin PorA family protein [Streptomyces sp. NPDC000987]|uniref:porin PorA family protein n=1 Tax=Streptomyces sp. NPDC000987 TaxID=3154374 RepID=UPI003330C069